MLHEAETLSSDKHFGSSLWMNFFSFTHLAQRRKSKQHSRISVIDTIDWRACLSFSLLQNAERGLFTRGFNELDCRVFRFVIHFAFFSLFSDYYVTRDLSFEILCSQCVFPFGAK